MPESHRSARTMRLALLAVCALAYLGLGGWVAHRWLSDDAPVRSPESPARDETRAGERPRKARSEPRGPAEVVALTGEAMGDRELAQATLEDLRARTASFLSAMAIPDAAIAVQSQHELIAQTLHDILERTPEAEQAFADELDRALCDPKAARHELLLMAKLALRLEETHALRGVQCILRKNTLSGELVEDDVLWAALDVWQGSGQPASPDLLALADRARDPRTLRRLARDERGVGTAQDAFHASTDLPGK